MTGCLILLCLLSVVRTTCSRQIHVGLMCLPFLNNRLSWTPVQQLWNNKDILKWVNFAASITYWESLMLKHTLVCKLLHNPKIHWCSTSNISVMDTLIAAEGWGKKGSSPLTSSPSALRVQPYFLISLTSILIDVSACQPSAAAARAPVEEESLFLLENPEDLPSNEMLSRSSESSCQKKAAQRRKLPGGERAQRPAQSTRQIATPTPRTLITFRGALRQITGKCHPSHITSSRQDISFTLGCNDKRWQP